MATPRSGRLDHSIHIHGASPKRAGRRHRPHAPADATLRRRHPTNRCQIAALRPRMRGCDGASPARATLRPPREARRHSPPTKGRPRTFARGALARVRSSAKPCSRSRCTGFRWRWPVPEGAGRRWGAGLRWRRRSQRGFPLARRGTIRVGVFSVVPKVTAAPRNCARNCARNSHSNPSKGGAERDYSNPSLPASFLITSPAP